MLLEISKVGNIDMTKKSREIHVAKKNRKFLLQYIVSLVILQDGMNRLQEFIKTTVLLML